MLGVAGTLKWEKKENGFIVEIPDSVQKNPPCLYAWTLKIPGISSDK